MPKIGAGVSILWASDTKRRHIPGCHPRESEGPGQAKEQSPWIPAFAGMTAGVCVKMRTLAQSGDPARSGQVAVENIASSPGSFKSLPSAPHRQVSRA